MTPRLARFCVAAASFALAFDALAQTPAAAPAPGGALPQNLPPAAQPQPSVPAAGDPNTLVTLKLPDGDIDTVISLLESFTGRTVIRPQALQTATYNLRINNLPKWKAIIAIETSLAMNQIGIAPLGDDFIKMVNLQLVKTEAPEMITGSTLDLPATGRVATKLFQLEFARAAELQPLLGSVLSPYYGGPVPLQNANAFLITDSISNLQRVELLLREVDKPITSGMKPKFYSLRNVKASELVNKLRTILTGTLQQQLGAATTYNADDRTNQVVVVTDPRQWDFFTELIEKLDQKSDPNTRTEVLYLKHAKAKDVVDVLSRIINGQTSAQRQNTGSVRPGMTPTPSVPGAPVPTPAAPAIVSASATGNSENSANEFSGLMTVVNDERSNSVVVFGTADDIRLVRDLVEKLDIVLAQVRIEVVIAEVTVGDNNQTGFSALGLKVDGDKLVGFSGSDIGPSISVTNGTITRPGLSGGFDLAADIALATTPRKTNNTILSHPSIVTSHGKQAKIFSGETRPVVTGVVAAAGATTSGLSTSSTVTQQQIGTTLTITPFIGADGSVNLDVAQSVEDVTSTVQVDANVQYVIGRRETTSNVSAKSGDILVFGGFRKHTDSKTTSRLGPIPIIGDLLGARKKETTHQELIFFLRPTVLTNVPATDNAEAMKLLEKLPTRDTIKEHLDPNFVAPPKSILDKILPK